MKNKRILLTLMIVCLMVNAFSSLNGLAVSNEVVADDEASLIGDSISTAAVVNSTTNQYTYEN